MDFKGQTLHKNGIEALHLSCEGLEHSILYKEWLIYFIIVNSEEELW